jgi:DNA-binding transcriptional ArsR family regulator
LPLRHGLSIFSSVVNNRGRITVVFSALADPTRRGIIERLARVEEIRVTSLAKPFHISLSAFSRHLRVLERARLIRRRREGPFTLSALGPLA